MLCDFFQDNVCSDGASKSGRQTRFHQENPHRYCHLPFGPTKHRDWKCSLQCRADLAAKEAAILTTYLESVPKKTHVYFGELKVQDDITVDEHKAIRKAFLKGLAALAQDRHAIIRIYVNSEVDDLLRCHYHYAMTSTTEVVKHAVKSAWDEACAGWTTIVHHEPPRSIRARAKYMFKDKISPGHVRLFRKKTIRITWGNIGRQSGFFPEPKDHYWREFVENTKKGLQ